MTRLVHVINTLEVGGGAEHVVALVRGAVRADYDCVVVTGRDGAARSRLEAAGVPVVVLGWMGPLAPLRLAAVLRRLRPELLHLHGSRAGFIGTIAAALLGIRPVVYTAHAFAFKRRLPAGLRRLAARADALTCGRADRVICLTRRDAEIARAAGVIRGPVDVIPNGVDPARFEGVSDRRAEFGLDPGVPVAAFIGRLVPDKDPLGLVSLAHTVRARVPAARFLIVGDGPLRGAVVEAVRRLGLDRSVVMTGSRADIPEILATADVVVLTSRWEGMPMVALEAMAAGRPLVAPALPGLDEVIEDGAAGRLVPPGDLAALSDAVAALLRDPQARQVLGARARTRVRDAFSLDRMIKQTLAVYARVRTGTGTVRITPVS